MLRVSRVDLDGVDHNLEQGCTGKRKLFFFFFFSGKCFDSIAIVFLSGIVVRVMVVQRCVNVW